MHNREIEVKFLEIDKSALIAKLSDLGAEDLGEELINEQIFYDKDRNWISEHKFVRIRKTSKGSFLTYKHTQDRTAEGVVEIEFEITQNSKVKDFLEAIGLPMFREQEKNRHKFKFKGVVIDIDTWPKIPTYVEIEGPSEDAIKAVSKTLGFDYAKGVFGTAAEVIEEIYRIPVRQLRYFTFSKAE